MQDLVVTTSWAEIALGGATTVQIQNKGACPVLLYAGPVAPASDAQDGVVAWPNGSVIGVADLAVGDRVFVRVTHAAAPGQSRIVVVL